MILAGLTVGDTLVLGLLARTSFMNVAYKISLMVLPENMASSRSLEHLGKYLFVLCNWCSSSSSDSEAVGDFWGCSTFPELDLASFVKLFFFKNSCGNE
jgi:hypothetical protein